MATRKKLCTRHAAMDLDWTGGAEGWGPWNPLPRGVTMKTVDSQRAMIRGWCESGNKCADVADVTD